MRDIPAPSATIPSIPARAKKSFIDVLAEIDDWYTKELTSMDSWNIPQELLNAESRREIRKIAFVYGLKEAILLSMVTPFIYGVLQGYLNPMPEAELIGKMLAIFVLGWPYIILIALPTFFAVKVRGVITEFLCKNAHVCRGLGLVSGTWAMAMAFILFSQNADWIFDYKLELYFPYLDRTIFRLFPMSWFWLIAGGFISAIIPALVAIYFPVRARSKWREFQELMRGLEA